MLGRADRGVTLIDISVALAIVGVLASIALPAYQAHLGRARRAEAISALSQLQAAQEQFRAHHGSYALQLRTLQGLVPRGEYYEIVLTASHASSYIARAQTIHPAQREEGCAELTLAVLDGVATHGPSARCWNQ